jgi:hypothetical protein
LDVEIIYLHEQALFFGEMVNHHHLVDNMEMVYYYDLPEIFLDYYYYSMVAILLME